MLETLGDVLAYKRAELHADLASRSSNRITCDTLLLSPRYESLFLLLWYGGYVTFMKYNETVEKALKRLVNRAKVNGISNETVANGAAPGSALAIPALPLVS